MICIFSFHYQSTSVIVPLGPDLPEPCSYSSIVTYEDSQGQKVLVTGCDENPEKIYELSGMSDHLEWRTLTNNFQHPRSNTVAMVIPDEFTHCF